NRRVRICREQEVKLGVEEVAPKPIIALAAAGQVCDAVAFALDHYVRTVLDQRGHSKATENSVAVGIRASQTARTEVLDDDGGVRINRGNDNSGNEQQAHGAQEFLH